MNYTGLLERSGRLMVAIAAGDSLGSTSELKRHPDIPYLLESVASTGWPFAQARGGPLELKPGDPTDETEMALCLFLSFLELYRFEPQDVVSRLIAWKRSHPRTIKAAAANALSWTASSDRWFEGPLHEWLQGKPSTISSALARNGIAAGMASTLDDAFRTSLLQCIMTDFCPEQVVCCCAHAFLLMELLGGAHPSEDWRQAFRLLFDLWLDRERDGAVGAWRETVGDRLTGSLDTLLSADLSVKDWNPLGADWSDSVDRPLHILRIVLWALHWSGSGDRLLSAPPRLPERLFHRRGSAALGWVALCGHHADTYAAAAAPLLVAAHGPLPQPMTSCLQILGRAQIRKAGALTGTF